MSKKTQLKKSDQQSTALQAIAEQFNIPKHSIKLATIVLANLFKACVVLSGHNSLITRATLEYRAKLLVLDKKKSAIENMVEQHFAENLPSEIRDEALLRVDDVVNSPVLTEFFRLLRAPESERPEYKSRRPKSKFQDESVWWTDFSQFLTMHKEKWRYKLMARALDISVMALQHDEEPYSYSTLWKIATMPVHCFEDLMQFKSVCGMLTNEHGYRLHFVPGTFGFLDGVEFAHEKYTGGEKRLVVELHNSLIEEGFSKDDYLLTMDYPCNIEFDTGNGVRYLKKHPNYVDPRDFELEEEWEIQQEAQKKKKLEEEWEIQQEAQKKKKLEHKIRFYGMYLNYVGEDILELADFVEPSPDKAAVLKFGMKQVKQESGVLFKKKK